ncbi:MAG: hypothetical protein MUC74_03890 [Ideonella sp.]|nr:hypothetical protein [Ideonella sp.]
MTPVSVSMPPPAPLRARLAVGVLLVVLLATLLVWSWDRADRGQPLGSGPIHEAVAAPVASGSMDPLDRALAVLADAQTLADPLGRTAATAEALSLLARDLAPRDPIDRLVRLQDLAGRHGLALSLEPAGSGAVAETGPSTVDGGLGLRWRMPVPRDEVAGAVDLVLLDLGVAGPVAAGPDASPGTTGRPAPTASGSVPEPAAPATDLGGRGVALALAALLAGVLVVRRLNRADPRLRPSHVHRPVGMAGTGDPGAAGWMRGSPPPTPSPAEDAPPRLGMSRESMPGEAGAAPPGDAAPEPWIVAFDPPAAPPDGPLVERVRTAGSPEGRAEVAPASPAVVAPGGADAEDLADLAGEASPGAAWRQVLDRLAAWTSPATDDVAMSRSPMPPAQTVEVPPPGADPVARETQAEAPIAVPSAHTTAGGPSAVLALLGLAPPGHEAARAAAILLPVDVAALLREEVAAWEPARPADAQEVPELVPAVLPLLDLDPRAVVRADADPQVLPIALRALLQQAVARAHRHVVASASADDRHVQVRVDDDGGAGWRDADTDFGAALGLGGAMPGAGRNPDRLGLALAVVHRGARWHGGSATLEDSPLGGRRVTLRWPVRAMDDLDPGKPDAVSPTAAGPGAAEPDATPAAG